MRHQVKNIIRSSRILNIVPRIAVASQYYNHRYWQILKWSVSSKEDTNFTYPLTKRNLQTLYQLISVVTGRSYQDVEGLGNEVQDDEELKAHVIKKIQASDQRSVADLRCDLHKRIGWYIMARITKPKVVIETGIDKGLGAVTLCAALLRNKAEGFDGFYYGTDINPEAGYMLDGKYSSVGKILYGDSVNSLQQFDKQVDLFINDSDHSAEYEYREYETIFPKLSENAIILGDNSHVTDELLKFSMAKGKKYLFYKEEPLDHWYPGGGIGFCF
ncbi:class I SAM-dependent methyltransferase [Aridibaculum aurantiacum]|uniref:class I SAM-dependent methyltransferase n=1 Tax=Aridibaculum aurantiacum TaxID=2810307 RepID=UPI001A9636CD|nr:class I SAM-dependent methyltransferase [Aridibaculum aurantiacum]